MRSSSCPRSLVPATSSPESRAMIRLSAKSSGTSSAAIREASACTSAVRPVPFSPTSKGLFSSRRARTCSIRRSSASRPTRGSKASWPAKRVRSRPYSSKTPISAPAAPAGLSSPSPSAKASRKIALLKPDVRRTERSRPSGSCAQARTRFAVPAGSPACCVASRSARESSSRKRDDRYATPVPSLVASLRSAHSESTRTSVGSTPAVCSAACTAGD